MTGAGTREDGGTPDASPPRARLSLTLRLTLLFALASSGVLTVLGMFLSSSLYAHFADLDIEALTGKLQMVQHSIDRARTPQDLRQLPAQIADALVGHDGLVVVIAEPSGQQLFMSEAADFPAALLQPHAQGLGGPLEWRSGKRRFRGISSTLRTAVPSHPEVVVGVATDTAQHQAFIRGMFRTVWIFVGGAALLTGVLGWVAVRQGLAPLRSMRDSAAAITAQRLDSRLPVDAVPAELADLTAALNAMLARLEDAFARLSAFSSDLAHELRTPISNLMMQTQVALGRARSAEHYRGILESNAEEFERLARMVSDMLFLAKAEHGLVVPHREPLALDAEILNLFDYYDALAEQRAIALVLEGAGIVDCDPLMIRRALSNLLSNAIRHSHAGDTVRVSVHEREGCTEVVVCNRGDTIPPEQLERVFDRFHRLDASRQHSGEGAGLGLAITRSIVVAHGGTVAARSTGGVTDFTIRLPRSAPG